MKNLSNLQTKFQDYLFCQSDEIVPVIVSDKVPAETRLNIYQHGYFIRLTESLTHDFPILHRLMGDQQFAELAHQYIMQYPSTFRSIRWFGQQFPEFIAAQTDISEYCWHSMAVLERALSNAFDAPDVTGITIDTMQNIPPDQWLDITFDVSPVMQLIDVQWNVLTVWQAMRAEKRISIKRYKKSHTIVVWRKDLETYFRQLTSVEAAMLKAIKEGKPFGEICENLSWRGSQSKLIGHFASLLKTWIHADLITGVNVN